MLTIKYTHSADNSHLFLCVFMLRNEMYPHCTYAILLIQSSNIMILNVTDGDDDVVDDDDDDDDDNDDLYYYYDYVYY